MAEGAIPWTATHQWADAHGIEGEQRDDLHFHVRALDQALLGWRAKQKPKE